MRTCGETAARGLEAGQGGVVTAPLPDPPASGGTQPPAGREERERRARERRFRAAVLELASTETRRRHPVLLHVGDPEGRVGVVVDDVGLDHALRADVLGALLWRHRDQQPLVWLTRTGPLAWQDVDARWFAAFRAARGEVLVGQDFLVVTRHGWHDPATGSSRTWKRIRDRRCG